MDLSGENLWTRSPPPHPRPLPPRGNFFENLGDFSPVNVVEIDQDTLAKPEK